MTFAVRLSKSFPTKKMERRPKRGNFRFDYRTKSNSRVKVDRSEVG